MISSLSRSRSRFKQVTLLAALLGLVVPAWANAGITSDLDTPPLVSSCSVHSASADEPMLDVWQCRIDAVIEKIVVSGTLTDALENGPEGFVAPAGIGARLQGEGVDLTWPINTVVHETVDVVPGATYTLTLHSRGSLAILAGTGDGAPVWYAGEHHQLAIVGGTSFTSIDDQVAFRDDPAMVRNDFPSASGDGGRSISVPLATVSDPVPVEAVGNNGYLTGANCSKSNEQITYVGRSYVSFWDPEFARVDYIFHRYRADGVTFGVPVRQIELCAVGKSEPQGGWETLQIGAGVTWKGFDGDDSGMNENRKVRSDAGVADPVPETYSLGISIGAGSGGVTGSITGSITQHPGALLKQSLLEPFAGFTDENQDDELETTTLSKYWRGLQTGWWEDDAAWQSHAGDTNPHGNIVHGLYEFPKSELKNADGTPRAVNLGFAVYLDQTCKDVCAMGTTPGIPCIPYVCALL